MFKRYCNDLALDLIEWANIEEHEDRIKAVKIYRIAGSKEIAYRNWIKISLLNTSYGRSPKRTFRW